jgi:voltage-dependent potassium channel beta subunit
MGNILKKLNWDRTSYVVSSKVFWGGKKPNQLGLSRKHVMEACNAALKRLQVDYLDLYFCHRPDPETPVEETVHAMNVLIQQGKIFYWGTSEWPADKIIAAHEFAAKNNLVGPTMEQPQYNLFHRERFEKEYAPLYTKYGIGTTIWSPLASGMLTGKYNDIQETTNTRMDRNDLKWLKEKMLGPESGNKLQQVRAFTKLANELGTVPAKLAIAWTLKNPNVSTVILGASKAEQLEETLTALEAIELLSEDVLKKIDLIFSQ